MSQADVFHILPILLLSLHLKLSVGLWRSTNPGGGGAFNSPVITSDGNWVVASDLGGLYVSRNRGKSWYAVGSNHGLTVTHISSLATVPSAGLVVGSDNGIYLTDSRASSVRRVYPSYHQPLYIAAVAVSRAVQSTVFAASHEKHDNLGATFLRSVNAGKSWSRMSFIPGVRALFIRTHPTLPSVLWLLTGEGRFAGSPHRAYRSLDGGKNWVLKGPSPNENVVDLDYALDKSRPSRMYLTLDPTKNLPSFWTSFDNGDTWMRTARLSNNPTPGIIVTNSNNSDHVRIIDAGSMRLWESTNAGKQWSARWLSVSGGWSQSDEDWGMGSSYQGLLHTVGYRSEDSSTILWVNNQFVYKSTSAGVKWADAVTRRVSKDYWISRGIDNVVPYVIEASLADPNLVYVGYADLGLWRSSNAGASWKSLNTPMFTGSKPDDGWWGKGGNTLTVVADPARKDVVWTHLTGNIGEHEAYLLKSANRGDDWEVLTSGLPSRKTYIESLELARDSAEDWRWLFVIVDGDIYLSEDDGNSWKSTLSCGDCVRVVYTEGNGVIAVGPSGIFRNWRGGIPGQWTDITSSLPAEARAGWSKGLHWLRDLWDYAGPVMIASRGSHELWLAIHRKGVYYSDNYAASWKLVLKSEFVRHVSVDHKTGEILVASSSAVTQGYYTPGSLGVLSHPTGKSASGWKRLNDGMAFPFALRVAVGRDGQRWCTSPGQGVMKWK